MKNKILVNVILVLVLAACSAPAQSTAPSGAPSATAPASPQQATKITPQAQQNYPPPGTVTDTPASEPTVAPTEDIPPTPYPAPVEITPQTTFDPLPDTTRYGVAKVDAILDVLLSGKSDAFPPFIVYTNAPCTTKSGLGGPPPCQGDEKDGTPVDVLPSMGTEGTFIRKSGDNLIDLPGYVQILGAFSVKADFKSEQYFPAGKYGLVLLVRKTQMVTLRVSDDGIIRVDYPLQMPNSTNQPDLASMLQPK